MVNNFDNRLARCEKNHTPAVLCWAVMKKIYFACSIRGGRDDAETYAQLVEHIKKSATVLSEIFADGKLTASGMDSPSSEIYAKDIAWVRETDAIIAEVTNPSLGVGYEIAYAEALGKPILALFCDDGTRKLSAMIGGAPGVTNRSYATLEEAYKFIDEFLD